MRQFTFLLISLTLFQLCWPQTGTIKGYIHNTREDKGMAFVKVSMVDHQMTTTTSDDGNFRMDDVLAGVYDLRLFNTSSLDTILTSIRVTSDTVVKLRVDYSPPCPYDQNDKVCPVCHQTDNVIPIVYGYPGEALRKKAQNGEVKLGGCIISSCDPHWYCKRDNERF